MRDKDSQKEIFEIYKEAFRQGLNHMSPLTYTKEMIKGGLIDRLA